MGTNQEQLEQIERYLADEMPEAERQTFEESLAGNPALAEALALRQALQHSRRHYIFTTLPAGSLTKRGVHLIAFLTNY